MRRIVSLQPSITLTLAELGALDQVVACTKYCADVSEEVRDRKVPIVHDSWSADAEEITRWKPDLVIASVPYRMESFAEILKASVPVLCLAPHDIRDVRSDILLLGDIVGKSERAWELNEEFGTEMQAITLQCGNATGERVYCEEWGKPLIQSQLWVSQLIQSAGGKMIGTPGATVTADEIRQQNPDVILAAWCGAGDRVPLEKIIRERQWSDTRAAKTGRVFCINDELLNTPAHCLIGGLKAIAWALHPDKFEKPVGIRQIAANPL